MAIALATPRRVRKNRNRWRKTASGRRHYNYFGDYDPSTGRYVQSDPIGLMGGLSTFGYVGSMPFAFVDWYGLSKQGSPIIIRPDDSKFRPGIHPPKIRIQDVTSRGIGRKVDDLASRRVLSLLTKGFVTISESGRAVPNPLGAGVTLGLYSADLGPSCNSINELDCDANGYPDSAELLLMNEGQSACPIRTFGLPTLPELPSHEEIPDILR